MNKEWKRSEAAEDKGRGPYRGEEQPEEGENQLISLVAQRFDGIIGTLEWLKFDQLKKGFRDRIEAIEELTRKSEGLSLKTESSPWGRNQVLEDSGASETARERLFINRRDVLSLMEETEKALHRITEEKTFVEERDLTEILELLGRLEKALDYRSSLLTE